jgi:heme/copper-type cytochrome/quinol oxidase subunit 1
MTEPAPRPPEDRPGDYNDVRDDFDDEFRRAMSPREVARRRLFVPGVAFLVIGVLLILGLFVGAAAALIDYLQSRRSDERLAIMIFVIWILGFGLPLFATVIAGGVCLLRLQRYRLALTAAYIVTGLSLAGPYGILFYPFGIWALILLYRPDIRREFEQARWGVRPPAPDERDERP